MTKTYLITGVAGFIGSNICERLLDLGEKVIGLDNFSCGFKENLEFIDSHKNKDNFTFYEGDIRNYEDCTKACQNVDYVLHQAALGSVPRSMEEPLLYHENNITGIVNMLEAAKNNNVKRFVFASSSSVYGDTPTLPKIETMSPRPKSPYAVNKLTGEYYCKLYTQCYGLPTIALRYFNIFGKRQNPKSQYSAVIPKFITAYLKNESPTIFGDGEQTRDFTYVENVIKANLNACQAEESAFGKAMNIGCGHRISLNELAKHIKDITGSSAEPIYEDNRAGDVRDSLASIEEAKTHLNLTDQILLKDGLIDTINYYKSL